MTMKYLNELVAQFQKDNIPMHPRTTQEIHEVKKLIGNHYLPIAYIEFLETMGRGTENTFFRGESCYINELLELNTWGAELLVENNLSLKLTENEFVFWMCQGCMFCFFKMNEGENPPVYVFSESNKKKEFYKITDSFTEFLHRRYLKDRDIFRDKN